VLPPVDFIVIDFDWSCIPNREIFSTMKGSGGFKSGTGAHPPPQKKKKKPTKMFVKIKLAVSFCYFGGIISLFWEGPSFPNFWIRHCRGQEHFMIVRFCTLDGFIVIDFDLGCITNREYTSTTQGANTVYNVREYLESR
jgi:hypothetical protein